MQRARTRELGGERARGLQVPAPSVFSEATKSLSIVVPAYNEEARLPATMDETLLCGPAPQAPQESFVGRR